MNMNYSVRQKKIKEKRQRELRQLVENSQQASRMVPAAKIHTEKSAAKSRLPQNSKPKSSIKSKSGQAYKTAQAKQIKKVPSNQSNTLQKFRDTISDYRSMPLSKSKRKKRNAIFYAMIFALVAGIVLLSVAIIFFDVLKIEVEGSTIYSDDEIVSACGISIEDNIFRIDKNDVAQKIKKQLPYIKEVVVRRKLPDTVVLEVHGAKPAGVVDTLRGYVLVDTDSKMLELFETPPDDYIIFEGAQLNSYEAGEIAQYENESAAELIAAISSGLSDAGLYEGTDYVNIEKRYDITFTYKNNIVCKLGDVTKLDVKLAMTKVVIDDNSIETKAIIDATDANEVRYLPVSE